MNVLVRLVYHCHGGSWNISPAAAAAAAAATQVLTFDVRTHHENSLGYIQSIISILFHVHF
jgi:hypothetical protein